MRLTLVLFMMMFWWVSITGQTKEITTFQDLVDHAIQFNYQKINAAYNRDLAGYKVKETLAKGLPQIDVVGTMDHYAELPTTVFPGEMMGKMWHYKWGNPIMPMWLPVLTSYYTVRNI